MQQRLGCPAKMISNALKWQQKPKAHRRKQATTVNTD